ncbi:MAG: hypothetical protein COT73_06220 [Bdellovibrio sp. CG10_big_fil_rev_8_21_14_0_10_47_8]|nr:MAG: hypothetical protein COT73_06220 [Bdellovibrio sp. CG10_big_fil_rev_8_21_14_0_10_47_8]
MKNTTKHPLLPSLLRLILSAVLLTPSMALAKTKTVRKVQEVNFSEIDLKGTVRNPDGAYLVQKRGIKFIPLYDVQKDMDSKIRESAQYVR